MRILDEVLQANKEFVVNKGNISQISKIPRKQVAIFTCMDTRLVDFLEPAMGINRGDAKVIKNAGNTLIDPKGGVIRSLVVAIFLLGVEEVFIIGHKDCGMAHINEADLIQKMTERGVSKEAIDDIPAFGEWLGAFKDPVSNVIKVTTEVRNSPLIPRDVPVHGLLFCPDNGQLEVIVEGYVKDKLG